ncbi:hypothetical protein BT96DRAFT_1002964 [Gymnopus androsaceus JB14]|uniref:Uncharacterized protein n=1 Tax=Gymnopus androsaceus JB14 TaxID=1447944 RepID=A0A6A4GVB4_9AGAR|nr:hypothetical protein BT96DRAFT_1002964 [Gymnopus androsaceus JB14]
MLLNGMGPGRADAGALPVPVWRGAHSEGEGENWLVAGSVPRSFYPSIPAPTAVSSDIVLASPIDIDAECDKVEDEENPELHSPVLQDEEPSMDDLDSIASSLDLRNILAVPDNDDLVKSSAKNEDDFFTVQLPSMLKSRYIYKASAIHLMISHEGYCLSTDRLPCVRGYTARGLKRSLDSDNMISGDVFTVGQLVAVAIKTEHIISVGIMKVMRIDSKNAAESGISDSSLTASGIDAPPLEDQMWVLPSNFATFTAAKKVKAGQTSQPPSIPKKRVGSTIDRTSNPSTNVPIIYTICHPNKLVINTPYPAVWKYNFNGHIQLKYPLLWDDPLQEVIEDAQHKALWNLVNVLQSEKDVMVAWACKRAAKQPIPNTADKEDGGVAKCARMVTDYAS